MTKLTLRNIMKYAHQQARIWVNNKHTDSYTIAFRIALKQEWTNLTRSMANDAARKARQVAKEKASVANAAPAPKATSWKSRRVMPVVVAEREGLNRGKSWFCSERDIQTKGACPSWEGQAICYVYA